MTIKPLICGVSGPVLTMEEKEFFSKLKPLGFALFKKNLLDRSQALALTDDIRAMLGREVPILIDQEGGRVLRLKSPECRQPLSPLDLAKFAYLSSPDIAKDTEILVYLNAILIALDMLEIGVNVNCAPVADLLIRNAHHITSTRSFGPNPLITSMLVNAMATGMIDAGVQPIMKHMLGQGRAMQDSHLELPIVKASMRELENNDFKVFKLAENIGWGMPAHIIYEALDRDQIVTYSQKAINYIRNEIGFKGILISDCLTMKALTQSWGEKATKAMAAGMDLIFYGGPNHAVIEELAKNIPDLPDDTWNKIQQGLNKSSTGEWSYIKIIHKFNELYECLNQELAVEIKNKSISKELEYILKVIEERNKMEADYSSPLYNA